MRLLWLALQPSLSGQSFHFTSKRRELVRSPEPLLEGLAKGLETTAKISGKRSPEGRSQKDLVARCSCKVRVAKLVAPGLTGIKEWIHTALVSQLIGSQRPLKDNVSLSLSLFHSLFCFAL